MNVVKTNKTTLVTGVKYLKEHLKLVLALNLRTNKLEKIRI
jgi:hypothetical protein